MSRASDLPLRRSQPELSSEIVRSVFQCRVSTMNRDNGADRRPTRRAKRAPSSPSSESDPVDVAVLPSTATAFQATSPSSLYTQPAGLYVPSSFREESSTLKDAPTARYLSAKTSDEFEMVANSVTYIGQTPKKPQKRIRLKTARRREQCRANQAKYRQKQLNHAETLEITVQKLRVDIPVLDLQRNRLFYGGQPNVWKLVVEYFHVFRFGVPVTLSVESIDSTDMTVDCLENAEAKHQLAFLRSSMAEDVILGERSGVDALMDQWRWYSSSFQSLYFQLERIERVSDHFVCATAVMNVTVTEATLTNVFPNVVADDSMASRLLGQRLRIPFSLVFEWDSSISRVSLLETTINLVSPLVKALGNVADVGLVLERARMTRDGARSLCRRKVSALAWTSLDNPHGQPPPTCKGRTVWYGIWLGFSNLASSLGGEAHGLWSESSWQSSHAVQILPAPQQLRGASTLLIQQPE
ncbi:hypothetical protein ON010_g2694 [Phytophthora cinnamomi]|nr:hypothetical protein ON010_g2694 [Phytophthora cinnamomi]